MNVYKIAFAGGAAAGKSTVIRGLEKLEKKGCGFSVLYLPEVAEFFFKDRDERINGADFPFLRQHYIYRAQLMNERNAIRTAEKFGCRNLLLISDRGVRDVYAYLENDDYLPEDEVPICLCGCETKEQLERHYDAVIYFEEATASNMTDKGTPRLEKNPGEFHDSAVASYKAWHSNANFFTMPQCPSPEDKVYRVAALINRLLECEIFSAEDK